MSLRESPAPNTLQGVRKMIRIKCTLHGPLAKSLVREFDETLDDSELTAAAIFFTHARIAGLKTEVIEGAEVFNSLLPVLPVAGGAQ